MPTYDGIGKSWADEVEQEGGLPTPLIHVDEDRKLKTLTEFKINEDGKKVKVIKTYRIDIQKMPKTVAKRKTWKKFGEASNDPPGPNPANTIISEDIYMVLVHNKENQLQTEESEDPFGKLKDKQKMVSCRICKGDHWTTKCPYKDSIAAPSMDGAPEGTAPAIGDDKAKQAGPPGKYVAPGRRGGVDSKTTVGERMGGRDESATIRVTNLSEDTTESDLQELFRPFGHIHRIFLAKDKVTGQSKGYAFINYSKREDAAKAIANLSGYGYDHLILNVEWAKPSGN
ncbi:DgyrCDS4916 [Dimorphilus gyrociliatus]|uniref:Eukaryotic translation initiation factor 3 subunit G n=1 Tax=Dimorphilus gyrociliatus TaxID=2664684 RepID=A0A7I8VID2_9ANNE|nr:DgyrCDS4916 [Dimorphilus gyrociliatus]